KRPARAPAALTATRSVSGPSAGATASSCASADRSDGIPAASVCSCRHCSDDVRVASEAKTAADAGATDAPAGTAPADAVPAVVAPPPPPPPQPATRTAVAATRTETRPARRTSPILLAARPTAHQRGHERVEALAGEHAADAFGDRQLDAEPVREVAQRRRRRQPLDDLPDRGRRLGLGRAARDQLARVAVSAVAAPAGDDQVAHAGEPGERLRPRAARLAEPRHLGEPAGDQRGLR